MVSNSVGLAGFDHELRAIVEAEAFGLVTIVDGPYLDVCTRHRAGVAAHRLPLSCLPAALRPSPLATARIVPLSTMDDPDAVFGDRLRGYNIAAVLVAAVEDGRALFWAGTSSEQPAWNPPAFELLARRIAGAYLSAEPAHARIERFARVSRVDEMLPILTSALDVRDVFSHLSAIAKRALPHDVATIQILDDDHEHARLYALEGASLDGVPLAFATNYPAVFNEHFLFSIHDDVRASAIERERPAAKAGMRAALRVPLRFDGRIGGALEFSAQSPAAYDETDVPIAWRIADYVAVAIGHFRLADRAQRAATLQARSQSLLLLDQLLPTLGDSLDIREVFDRISELAHDAIPHDALGLPLLTDDGDHIIPFATAGLANRTFPALLPLSASARYLFSTPWEYEIFDDASRAKEIGQTPYSHLGFESLLRVPIRVEGRTAGALVFLSRQPSAYAPRDVTVAKRIASHVALALSHQRMAEEARRTEALRARAASLELLDEMLATVTGSGELPDVFGRVSAVAQRVLEHDALVLTAVNPDRVTARVYASRTPAASTFPETVEVPPYMLANPAWEHEIIDDLQALEDQRGLAAGRLGFRSALRVSIRLDGEYVAGVSFLSFKPALYKANDIVVARRIADRLALNFARERRAASSRRADEAAARASRLESRVRELTDELDARTGYRRIVGDSPSWRTVLTQATQVASTETTVLLLGESGTGKEVVARFIHRASSRQDGPFIALNCAALPEHLLEAELFGYERGAFTGATQSKPGQLEQAGGGTLFLDEIGEMSQSSQAKLLRVLQEREFQRLGGTRVLRTDARVIAATNRDLRRAIENGTFREDLYYRLNVFAINLPPLRDRREDVLPLSEAFLTEFGRSLGRPPAGISRDARRQLMDYHWPGNVRELRNILERASILCDGGLITAEHLAITVTSGGATTPAGEVGATASLAESAPSSGWSETGATDPSTKLRVGPEQGRGAERSTPGPAAPAGDLPSMERAMVEQALLKHRFNKSKAAKELGLTRAQLYVRMKRHGLE